MQFKSDLKFWDGSRQHWTLSVERFELWLPPWFGRHSTRLPRPPWLRGAGLPPFSIRRRGPGPYHLNPKMADLIRSWASFKSETLTLVIVYTVHAIHGRIYNANALGENLRTVFLGFRFQERPDMDCLGVWGLCHRWHNMTRNEIKLHNVASTYIWYRKQSLTWHPDRGGAVRAPSFIPEELVFFFSLGNMAGLLQPSRSSGWGGRVNHGRRRMS